MSEFLFHTVQTRPLIRGIQMSGPIRFNPNAGSEQTRPLEDWPAGSWLAIHVETGRRQMVSASHWDQLLEAYGSEAIHRIKGC